MTSRPIAYQGVSIVSKDIECIKEYHGASSVSRSKGYQEVSNVYQVYQRVSGVYQMYQVHQMYMSNEDIYGCSHDISKEFDSWS